MSEEKPLLEEFFDWLFGLLSPKSSVEDSGETPDKESSPTPTDPTEDYEGIPEKRPDPEPEPRPPTGREDPRMRGMVS